MARRYRKRPARRSSLEATPLERGLATLELGDGDLTQEDLLAVTEDQAAKFFMRDLRRRMEPLNRYPHRYKGENGEEQFSRDWGDIKRYYKVYVLHQGWSEAKYLSVLHGIMKREAPLSHQIITGYGKKYDEAREWRMRTGEKTTPLKPV